PGWNYNAARGCFVLRLNGARRAMDSGLTPRWVPAVERYAGAAVLTLAATIVVLLLQRLGDIPDAMVFAATVALSARFFGTGPSLLASALSIIAIDLLILPPMGSVELTHPEELAYVAVFVVLVLVISGTMHSLRRAQTEAEQL